MSRNLRVLHVINSLTTGGAETVLYRLVTYPSEVEHAVICLEGRAWYSGKLEEHGVNVHHLDWNSARFGLGSILRLHRLIRADKADVVQAWMYRSNLLAGLSGRIAGKPVVWNIRASAPASLRLRSRILARLGGILASGVPQYVVNCSAASSRQHARIGYGAADGSVIPNGYDSEVFGPDEAARTKVREALGIEPDSFVVATIGRWHPQKGLPDLLHGMRLLKERNIAPTLLIVGRGIDAENRELREMVERSGCADRVLLAGQRSDIPDIARAADLHVLASIGGEGFPNVVAETMLSGTPNVVTDIGDSAMIVGDTGWVVPPGEPGLLADAIEQAFREWTSSRSQWDERRERARRRIADSFSLDRMVHAYRDVWNKVTRPLDLSFDKVESPPTPRSD